MESLEDQVVAVDKLIVPTPEFLELAARAAETVRQFILHSPLAPYLVAPSGCLEIGSVTRQTATVWTSDQDLLMPVTVPPKLEQTFSESVRSLNIRAFNPLFRVPWPTVDPAAFRRYIFEALDRPSDWRVGAVTADSNPRTRFPSPVARSNRITLLKLQPHSIRFEFERQGIHIDLVPCIAGHYVGSKHSRDAKTEEKQATGEVFVLDYHQLAWIRSAPCLHTQAVRNLDAHLGGGLRRTVRVLKAWNRALRADLRLPSFILEALTVRSLARALDRRQRGESSQPSGDTDTSIWGILRGMREDLESSTVEKLFRSESLGPTVARAFPAYLLRSLPSDLIGFGLEIQRIIKSPQMWVDQLKAEVLETRSASNIGLRALPQEPADTPAFNERKRQADRALIEDLRRIEHELSSAWGLWQPTQLELTELGARLMHMCYRNMPGPDVEAFLVQHFGEGTILARGIAAHQQALEKATVARQRKQSPDPAIKEKSRTEERAP